MAKGTVDHSRADTNSTLVGRTLPEPMLWIIRGAKPRRICGIRVRGLDAQPPNHEVVLVLTPDLRPRYPLASAEVFDTAEAAAASLTPIPGYVVRVRANRRRVVRRELVVLRGDGRYWPADTSGLWRSAFVSRAEAQAAARAD